ncbi:MAG: hypothetical protein ACLUEQ_12090 [Cloacibacillus evryensis]
MTKTPFSSPNSAAAFRRRQRTRRPVPELDEIYVQTKLPYDIDFRTGRWLEDFERANGLYWSQYEMNSLYGSYRTDGFRFHKNFGSFDATAFIGRNARHGEFSSKC